MRTQPAPIEHADDEVDLNPLIDIVTMLIVFFVVAGKLSVDLRGEQVTVPPTRTGNWCDLRRDWNLLILNVAKPQRAADGRMVTILRIGDRTFHASADDHTAWRQLRDLLDRVYDRAARYPDPVQPNHWLPKVVVELRADADVPLATVHTVQAVLADSVDPARGLLPRERALRPFTVIDYATRQP